MTALILHTGVLSAQNIHPDILQKKWNALWIHVPGEPENDYGVYKFRKNLELAEKPASFIVHVSGDNRYKLYVNGQFVSHGPARGEIFHYNFETVDLAPYLQKGKNVIAATVWNFGKYRAEAQMSYRTAFILQGNSQKEHQPQLVVSARRKLSADCTIVNLYFLCLRTWRKDRF